MQTFRIKLRDLFDGQLDTQDVNLQSVEQIATHLAEHLPFLPKPSSIEVDGDVVVITFDKHTTAQQDEAKRLAGKAAKRAKEGDHDKAIGIYKSALELDPLLNSARKDLAMAYSEIGDPDNAINHLIESLRLEPNDVPSRVILANLYIKEKVDLGTAQQILRRALDIDPNNSWALNSLAAVYMEKGDVDKAMALFDQSIAINPTYPNPYYGKALLLHTKLDRPEEAELILEALFAKAKKQDARSDNVFNQARALYIQIQENLAESNQLVAAAVINNYTSEIEALSGFPTVIEEKEFEDLTGATIQMAWKYHRDHHSLLTRKGYPPILLSHLEMHELTHVKLEAKARSEHKNKFFTTTAKTMDHAMQSLAPDLAKFKKDGHSVQWISGLSRTLIEGLMGFLYNCPIDMVIEQELRTNYPVLKHAQFLSLGKLAEEARQVNHDPTLREFTPRKIHAASMALNGAYAIFLDNLFNRTTEFVKPYIDGGVFNTSRQLYDLWGSSSIFMTPGSEYQLIDNFANILGLNGWYEWKDDPMYDTGNPEDAPPGVTNETLLDAKKPASVFYLLSAIKRFNKMTQEEIKNIGFEVAMLGQQGIDYTNANTRYNLRSLPAEKFTGLQLMSLMFVAFKTIMPGQDVGLDLNAEYKMALEMFEAEQKNGSV